MLDRRDRVEDFHDRAIGYGAANSLAVAKHLAEASEYNNLKRHNNEIER